ncbi:MAG: thioesterase family protein [Pseudomonadota bacterium]
MQQESISSSYCAKIPTRWGDMDAFGHMNNAVYLTYFEQARIQWFESLNIFISNQTEGPIQYDSHVTYLRPIVYPATLFIDLNIVEFSQRSFVVGYAVYISEQKDKKFAEGTTKIVWFDYQQGKSKAIPESLLARLKK